MPRFSTLCQIFPEVPRHSCFATQLNQELDTEPLSRPPDSAFPSISPLAALSAQVLSTSVKNIIKTISMRSCGVKLS